LFREEIPSDGDNAEAPAGGDGSDAMQAKAMSDEAQSEDTELSSKSVIAATSEASPTNTQREINTGSETKMKAKKTRKKAKQRLTRIEVVHCDIIKDDFWNDRPMILGE